MSATVSQVQRTTSTWRPFTIVLGLTVASTLPALAVAVLSIWNIWQEDLWQAQSLLLPVGSQWQGVGSSFGFTTLVSFISMLALVAGLNTAVGALILGVNATWHRRASAWPAWLLLTFGLGGFYAWFFGPGIWRARLTSYTPFPPSAAAELARLGVAVALLGVAVGSAWWMRRHAELTTAGRAR